MIRIVHYLTFTLFMLSAISHRGFAASEADVIVYGSTPGGFCAAIAAAREGASVILLEPTDHVGAMNTGGLSHCDSNQMTRETLMGLFDEWHTRVVKDYTDRGFKVAKHWKGDPTDPDTVDRTPNDRDEKFVRDYLHVHLPSANGSVLAFKICMYTHGGPWLGLLPGEKRVSFGLACNEGGFKFSSAYGEALADLATEGKTELPVQFMRPR